MCAKAYEEGGLGCEKIMIDWTGDSCDVSVYIFDVFVVPIFMGT